MYIYFSVFTISVYFLFNAIYYVFYMYTCIFIYFCFIHFILIMFYISFVFDFFVSCKAGATNEAIWTRGGGNEVMTDITNEALCGVYYVIRIILSIQHIILHDILYYNITYYCNILYYIILHYITSITIMIIVLIQRLSMTTYSIVN